jgi:peptidyl-prolyl cis-trans isomerase C
MTRRSNPVLPFFALTALLAAALAGCNKGKPGDGATVAQANPSAASGQTQSAAGSAAGQTESPVQALPGHLANTSPADAKPVDPSQLPNVVARINGIEVKKDELVKEADAMRMQLAQTQGIQEPLNTGFYKNVLDGIIARTLLQQEAKEQKVAVTDAEVEQQMAALRSRFPDAATFQKALASQGMTEASLRQQMRRDGAIQKLVQTKVLTDLTVSDQAAKDFYDKNQDKLKQPERVHLRHILVRADANAPAADKAKAKAKAEELLKRVQNGEDFAKVAAESSDDPGSKGRGGDLSWVGRGQAPPPIDKAAFALTKPNDLSPVVESEYGYHIIQLLERQDATVPPFEQVKPRIAEFLKQRQSQEKLHAHVQELRSKGKVETFI